MAFVGNEPLSLVVQLRQPRTGRTASVLALTAPQGSAGPFIKDRDAAIRETLARLANFAGN